MSLQSTAAVNEASFERYAKLVQALLPDAAGCALCDENGDATHFRNFARDADTQASIDKLADMDSDWASRTNPNLYECGDKTLLIRGLANSRKEVVASLAVLMPADKASVVDHPHLTAIAECIEHELKLDAELTSMTLELTERYEELNLVYHTEDQVNYFRQGQVALKDLTRNCLDYLDVGLSVLILKKKGVTLSFDHPQNPIPNARRVRARLAGALYDWVTRHGETVVINKASDSLAAELIQGIPHRVICCPIFESSGKVVGVLATVNTYEKPTFSNSDRNLLQIMARKASKIIVANYDPLTGLMNRNGYEYFLAAALTQARSSDAEKCLLHLNIDQLHIINDTVGHAAGDEIIRSVADTIDGMKREGDPLSRLGGDEFGLLMNDCPVADAAEFAERVCQEVEDSTVIYDGDHYKVTVSIGVAMITPLSKSVAQVIGGAELACSVAKEQGQNRVEVYRRENADVVRREEEVRYVAHIQTALAENSFELYCQPIQALSDDGHVHHTEILLRLVQDGGDVMEPEKFIPSAERYHMMPSVDRWVVRETLSMLSEIDADALAGGNFAINLSGQSLSENGFLEFIKEEIVKSGVPPTSLCFEVTETAAVAKMEKAIAFMNAIRKIGCAFSLDDFGSGTSSFGYLKNLPVDYLKIDGAIIRDMVKDETSAAMVLAINQVGHTMNLRTIAEYVETPDIIDHLKKIGVDYAQGYAIGRPRPFADRLQELLAPSSRAAAS